jgi:glycosyltransferase involved in cell wall biosynthesis
MKKYFYSIIIPAYNAEKSIVRCLNSVSSQNFSDYELLLVNDGSLDATLSLVEEWRDQNAHIAMLIINQGNEGLGAARNKAIKAAKGQFCALLDADDYWDSNKLASCYSFLNKSPECDVLYHEVLNVGLNGEKKRNVFALSSASDLMLKGCPIVPSATILCTETAQVFPFSTEAKFHGSEDLYLWLELLAAGKSFYFWPEAISYYQETGGMSSRIDEHLKKVENVYEHFYQQGLYNRLKFEQALQRKWYEAARFYQKRGQHHYADRYYAMADGKSLKVFTLKIMNRLGLNY